MEVIVSALQDFMTQGQLLVARPVHHHAMSVVGLLQPVQVVFQTTT